MYSLSHIHTLKTCGIWLFPPPPKVWTLPVYFGENPFNFLSYLLPLSLSLARLPLSVRGNYITCIWFLDDIKSQRVNDLTKNKTILKNGLNKLKRIIGKWCSITRIFSPAFLGFVSNHVQFFLTNEKQLIHVCHKRN